MSEQLELPFIWKPSIRLAIATCAFREKEQALTAYLQKLDSYEETFSRVPKQEWDLLFERTFKIAEEYRAIRLRQRR